MSTSASTRIVAGVNGSPASQQAVEAAAREADIRGHPLHLVHVFNWPPGIGRHVGSVSGLLRHATVAATRVAPALTITTEVMEGHPLTGLLRLSRRAALTVIGDGDLNDRVCMPQQAMAVQLTARAFGTVMVTRSVPAPDGPVLAGVDDSPSAEPVLDFAFDAAARRRVGLIVVHVGEAGTRIEALEKAIASRARAYGTGARLRIMQGDPTTEMALASREGSLIVVGARGRLPYHGLLGSVAQTVLHHGRAPVAVVRGTRTVPGGPAGTDQPARRNAIDCAGVPEAPAPRRKHQTTSR